MCVPLLRPLPSPLGPSVTLRGETRPATNVGNTMLRNGEVVPDFTLRDTEDNEFDLQQYVTGITILSWIRGEW